jgi:CRP/FNR family transcriptional regulator, cyclic AMP receptor protein
MADPQTIDDLIAGVPTFTGLDSEWLELIAGCGRTRGFDAGEYLFRADEPADDFFVIRRGRLALEVFVPGRGQVIVGTHGAGELVGWSWLFPPYRWQFDGRAVEPTRTIAFDGACLRGKCDADPALGYELMRRFALKMLERLQATRFQLLDVYGHTPVG